MTTRNSMRGCWRRSGPSRSNRMSKTESSPAVQLDRLITGYWVSQAVYAAAKLGLADLLKDGPKSIDELAAATATNPDALYRLLRALASIGIFAEGEPRRFF